MTIAERKIKQEKEKEVKNWEAKTRNNVWARSL
jgi:hypothetical protein